MDLTNGLAFCFECDENAGTSLADANGGAYSGTLQGGATWGAGKLGASSVSLDGVDDTVSMAQIAELVSAAQFSIGFWMRKTSSGAGFDTFFSLYSSFDNRIEVRLGGTGVGNTSNAVFNISVAAATMNAYNAAGGGNAVFSNSTWYHVLAVFDGTATGNANRAKLYIDGALQTLTFSGDAPAASSGTAGANSYWGSRGATATLPFPGLMDQLCVWDRPLTQEEIDYLVNAGSGRPFSEFSDPVVAASPSLSMSGFSMGIDDANFFFE